MELDIIPVFVYIKPEDAATFAHRFMGAIMYEFLTRRGLAPEEDFEQLLSLVIDHAPQDGRGHPAPASDH